MQDLLLDPASDAADVFIDTDPTIYTGRINLVARPEIFESRPEALLAAMLSPIFALLYTLRPLRPSARDTGRGRRRRADTRGADMKRASMLWSMACMLALPLLGSAAAAQSTRPRGHDHSHAAVDAGPQPPRRTAGADSTPAARSGGSIDHAGQPDSRGAGPRGHQCRESARPERADPSLHAPTGAADTPARSTPSPGKTTSAPPSQTARRSRFSTSPSISPAARGSRSS